MNTDNFLIEERDLELARNICKIIDNADTRNRAVANAVAANIAAKYFDTEQYNIDTTSGLHNIGNVLEDIDISDIYINNATIPISKHRRKQLKARLIEVLGDKVC